METQVVMMKTVISKKPSENMLLLKMEEVAESGIQVIEPRLEKYGT